MRTRLTSIVLALFALGGVYNKGAQELPGMKSRLDKFQAAQMFNGAQSPLGPIAQLYPDVIRANSASPSTVPRFPWSNLLGRRLLVPQQYTTIQTAIDSAVHGDTVLVSSGTYYENINFRGKAIVAASYMILNNDTTYRNSTIINGSQPSDPNKGSVVSFISGEDTTSVIFGFTITGGTGTLYDATHKVGGGIYCKNSGARIVQNKIVFNSITHNQESLGGGIGSFPMQSLKHVIIEENVIESNSLYSQNGTLGGGIFLDQGRIMQNRIRNNLSSGGVSYVGFGGGIGCSCDTTIARTLVEIVGNTITDNQATSASANYGGIGGGVAVDYCNVLLVENRITYNKVNGAKPDGGAGVRFLCTGPSMVQDNVISFNSSFNPASGLWGLGGALLAYETVNLTIQRNQFEGNESAGGGGVSTYSTHGTVISNNAFLRNLSYIGGGVSDHLSVGSVISSNRFSGNTASYHGGGIFIVDCSPRICNNLILGNTAVFNGGGIYVGDQNSDAQIINNTIVGDTASLYGGGICTNSVSPIVMNTIVWGNVAPNGAQIYTLGGNTRVVYSDVQDTLWQGPENVNIDPKIVADSLSDSSQCIGAGIDAYDLGGGDLMLCPEEDINGRSRPLPEKSMPDLGACESLRGLPLPTDVSPGIQGHFPAAYVLKQNYPNPFNPITTIEFQIPSSAFVILRIFDLLGQEKAALVSEELAPGQYGYEWDARGSASGVYFCKMEAGSFTLTRKMLLIR